MNTNSSYFAVVSTLSFFHSEQKLFDIIDQFQTNQISVNKLKLYLREYTLSNIISNSQEIKLNLIFKYSEQLTILSSGVGLNYIKSIMDLNEGVENLISQNASEVKLNEFIDEKVQRIKAFSSELNSFS